MVFDHAHIVDDALREVLVPSGDVHCAEQTGFMVPYIDDPRPESDFGNSSALLWINRTATGNPNGVSIPVPFADHGADGG
jgi:hypothetical protein